MRRIAIATWFNEGDCNYGQTLQAFATYKAVSHLTSVDSCLVEVLNYRKNLSFRSKYGWGGRLYHQIRSRTFHEHLRAYRFTRFIRREIHLSRPLQSAAVFQDYVTRGRFSVLLAGSDQIWNPQGKLDPCYFFPFPTSARKITYASSLTSLPIWHSSPALQEKLLSYRGFIADFHSISVRETDSLRIMEQVAPASVQLVLDPVFLLPKNEWVRLCGRIRGRYILVYWMGLLGTHAKLIDGIARTHGLRVLYIPGAAEEQNAPPHWQTIPSASPTTFLSYIRDASFICTDSFHGTAFSIIFEKQFLAFPRITAAIPQSSARLTDLLRRFDLERCMPTRKHVTPTDPIEFATTTPLVQQAISCSIDYLKKALAADPIAGS